MKLSENAKLSSFYDVIIIRYLEIALKSDQVRKRLVEKLKTNIKLQLEKAHLPIVNIWHDWGFIYLKVDQSLFDAVIPVLMKVFGIYSISFAHETSIEFDTIIAETVKFAEIIIQKNETFGIKARKVGKHPFSSQDIAIKAGSDILDRLNPDRSIKVNLDNPNHLIEVVVREQKTVIFDEILITIWGGNPVDLPRGCISIFSGDISEFISSFLVMKRGMFILPLIFTQDETHLEQIKNILKEFVKYLPLINFQVLTINATQIEDYVSSNLRIHPVLKNLIETIEDRQFLEKIMEESLRLRITEWIIENQYKIFTYFKEAKKIEEKSNISGLEPSNNGFIRFINVSEGNFFENCNIAESNFIKNISCSPIPIFRAAISFTEKELEEDLQKIDPNCFEIYQKGSLKSKSGQDICLRKDVSFLKRLDKKMEEKLNKILFDIQKDILFQLGLSDPSIEIAMEPFQIIKIY